MQFLSTFETEQETDLGHDPADNIDITLYISMFTIESENSNSETRQTLRFIGDYAALYL